MTGGQVISTEEERGNPEGSYRPILLAALLTLTLAGLIVSIWLTVIGAVLSIVVLVAWATEKFLGLDFAEDAGTGAPATGEKEAASAESARPAVWWGLMFFITTEAILFINLIASYVHLRVSNPVWPPVGLVERDLLFPTINTVVLILSGIPAFSAARAIKRGDRRGLQIGLILSVLLGTIFLAGQGFEYAATGIKMQGSVFLAGFFVLTGFHGFHVAAGIGLLLFTFARSLRGHFSIQSHFTVDVATTYWHFVDAVWIVLFAVLYLFQ